SVHAVHIQLEHQRRAAAVLPDLGLLARVVAGRPWSALRALGVDEVRVPHRRAALADLPGAAAVAALRRRVSGRDGRGVLRGAARAEPAAGATRLLRPFGSLADRPRRALVALGLGPVPRPGPAGPSPRPARAPGASPRRRRRRGLRAAPQVAAPARGAD